MGRKKLLIEEKTRVLTMLENGVPINPFDRKLARVKTGYL